MGKDTVVIHNKTDKPDNVVKRENDMLEKYTDIQKSLPGWMRGFFMYLNNNVLPMTRLSYAREVVIFFNYLVDEHIFTRDISDIKDIKPEDLNEIQARDVNLFLDYCRRYEVEKEEKTEIFTNANAALSHKKSTVSVLYKYLYRDGYVEKNITDGFDPIRLPKPGEREIKHLEDDEVMRMLDCVSTGECLTAHELKYWKKTRYRDKLILLILVTYGLRLSELQQLNVSSFNFDRGEFKIYRKRGKESVMPINNTISEAFADYVTMERKPDDELDDINKDALLLSLQGKRLTDKQIREIVKKYTSVAMGTSHKDGYSPHKLRATAATSLIGRGNSIYDVQELLDHALS